MKFVIVREEFRQLFVRAKFRNFRRKFFAKILRAKQRIATVQNHHTRCRAPQNLKQLCRVVDFAKSVELVAHHIQKQAIFRLNLLHKMRRVRLVKLQNSDVGWQISTKINTFQKRRRHATHEIRASFISKNSQTLTFEQLDNHFRSGRFAVRARNHHHAVRQFFERILNEVRVSFFDKKPRQSRTAAFDFRDFLNCFS